MIPALVLPVLLATVAEEEAAAEEAADAEAGAEMEEDEEEEEVPRFGGVTYARRSPMWRIFTPYS